MKYVKLFEGFLNESSIETQIIPFLKLPVGYTTVIEDDDINVTILNNGKEAGFFRFSGTETFKGIDYIVAETIFIEPEHRRKGIYGAIINAAILYGKKNGKTKGVISFPFDMDSGDFERSQDANAFWENLVVNKKAVKHKTDDGIIYTTKIA